MNTKLLTVIAFFLLSGCKTLENQGKPAVLSESEADAALKQGDAAKAITGYEPITIENPANIAVKNKLAVAYLSDNKPYKAITVLEEILAHEPENLPALRGMGRAHLLKNNPAAALPFLEKAAKLSPTKSNLTALGVVNDMLGKHEKAQKVYNTALKNAPKDGTVLNNRGLSLLMMGKNKEAITLLKTAPPSTQQRGNLALALGIDNQEDNARKVLSTDFQAVDIEKNITVYQEIREQLKNGGKLNTILRQRQ